MSWFTAFVQWLLRAKTPPPPPSPPPVVKLSPVPHLLMSTGPSQNIWTIAADGSDWRGFTEHGNTPSWTPDGEIIFATPSGNEIKLMDATGRNVRTVGNLRHLRGINKPHMVGNTIVFTTTLHGNTGAVWVMQKDGTGLRMLTPAGTAAFLSPDAKWVTFTRETLGRTLPMRRQIWRVSIDEFNERQVTFGDDPVHPDGNASAISPDGNTIAVFWGPEDDGVTGPDKWGQRDLAEVSAFGGTPKMIVAATPARQPGFPQNYPPLPALLAADNPAPYRDAAGLDWWIFDGGRPDGEGGTFKVRVGGGPITRLSREYRGAGNVPMR